MKICPRISNSKSFKLECNYIIIRSAAGPRLQISVLGTLYCCQFTSSQNYLGILPLLSLLHPSSPMDAVQTYPLYCILQGDSDSDAENNPEKRGKKSREDRKLEAYLRQFEKMEKKEKRKQQTQKEPKQELISPVSQEVPLNKLSSKNMKVMRRTLNRKRTGRKRARLSSCSSEPLSPDDHSSTASTPNAQELSSVTPSTSPNRSFKFLKDSKQVRVDYNPLSACCTTGSCF